MNDYYISGDTLYRNGNPILEVREGVPKVEYEDILKQVLCGLKIVDALNGYYEKET